MAGWLTLDDPDCAWQRLRLSDVLLCAAVDHDLVCSEQPASPPLTVCPCCKSVSGFVCPCVPAAAGSSDSSSKKAAHCWNSTRPNLSYIDGRTAWRTVAECLHKTALVALCLSVQHCTAASQGLTIHSVLQIYCKSPLYPVFRSMTHLMGSLQSLSFLEGAVRSYVWPRVLETKLPPISLAILGIFNKTLNNSMQMFLGHNVETGESCGNFFHLSVRLN